MALHLQAMLLAFAVAAVLTAHVVVQLSAAIDRRDVELAVARVEVARAERLAALTTLAAGAAHELATPLGTIAIAAAELDRALASQPDALRDDARLIRAEVRRCRDILDRLATDAGDTRGEAPETLDAVRVVAGVRSELAADAARVDVAGATVACRVSAPPRALVTALVNVVRNALDAGTRVHLDVAADDARVRFIVRDDGPGMSPTVLARAGEPFFTTKPPGRGMGLGLFLTRTLCEQLGGRLEIASTPGAGTTVTLVLPAVPSPPAEVRGAA
jgi:two-component system sensor histidine kinase RegB